MKQKITARTLALGGVVAALYVALTMLSAAFGLASGVIQVRLSEAMTILPVFSAAAVPGLALGCLLANLLTGCALWDVVFGTRLSPLYKSSPSSPQAIISPAPTVSTRNHQASRAP